MEINRKEVVKGFLHNLYRISNKEYQKRVWIRGAGPECHDFDEAVNDFFGDGDPILENYRIYGLSQVQYQLLKKFRDKFRVFSDENDWPPEFIDSPEWAEIMDLAKEVLKAFNFPLSAVNTKKYLIDLISLIKEQAKLDDTEGAITGYYSIVDLLKHQAFVFCFDQKKLGLAEINPDMHMIACEEGHCAVEVMSEERIKEYLRDTIKILKERAREAKKAADNPEAHQSAEFNAEYLKAYYKVISAMKTRASVFGIDLKEINLDDIDPDRDLLVSKST
jgi:hypothetical protein